MVSYPHYNLMDKEVHDERLRQDSVWGEQNHPDGTGPESAPLFLIVGVESFTPSTELRKLAQSGCKIAADEEVISWSDILLEEVFEAFAEKDPKKLYIELTQVEAVARAWRENIRRRGDVS